MYCKKCGNELREGEEVCLKCGQKVRESEKPETTDQTVKKGKVKKNRIILAAVVVCILGIMGWFYYQLNSGGLYKSGGLKKIYDITGICLQHHYKPADCTNPETCEICSKETGEPLGHQWVEATCEEPKICSVCQEKEGEPLGHQWVEATCEEPKTCSVCQKKEGEALGHTTRMGLCTNCNEYQYELMDEFLQIYEYCKDGNENITAADGFINKSSMSSVYAAYLACTSMATYYKRAQEDYQKAYDLCGDYEEFADLKIKIKNVMDSLLISGPSNDYNSCIAFLEGTKNILKNEEAYLKYSSELMKEWKKDNSEEK